MAYHWEMAAGKADVAIIGAGVVGLACAAVLAREGRSVILLERHPSEGRETSSRNSGVIHGGLYYPADSLKASTCVEGRELLYRRCVRDGIDHRRTGKLIVAVEDAEVPALERIWATAQAAGVANLETWSAADLRRREPLLRARAGLWSPSTGIVDAHGVMVSYRREAQRHGCDIAFHTEVLGVERSARSWRIETRHSGGESHAIDSEWVINAAGLDADRLAAMAGIDVDTLGWRIHYCKGDYFALSAAAPRPHSHLVYPIPAGPGLGVHLTTNLGGQRLVGPDATYVANVGYGIDETKAPLLARAVARYLPGVEAAHLTADYAGVRPKLAGPGIAFRDFVVADSARFGAPGMIHLVGIESPGLTASEALAMRVAALLDA